MENCLINIKERVRSIPGYITPAPEAPVKLNQNENPFPVPNEIRTRILEKIKKLPWERYPVSDPVELRHKLGKYAQFPVEGILVGNGSNELLLNVFLASVSSGDNVLLIAPTFSLYELLGNALEAQIWTVSLTRDLEFDVDGLCRMIEKVNPRLTIFPSPNNPTGSVITREGLIQILDNAAGLVGVDEAYIEFTNDRFGAQELIENYSNFFVLRTYSKSMSAAGIRLGYLLAQQALTHEIQKVQLPYNIGWFSRCAAEILLDEESLLKERIVYLKKQRDYLYDQLSTIAGIKPYPSGANFVLFECLTRDAKEVFNLLQEKGILIRDVTSYPMLSRALRVTAGTEEENKAFLKTLKEIM